MSKKSSYRLTLALLFCCGVAGCSEDGGPGTEPPADPAQSSPNQQPTRPQEVPPPISGGTLLIARDGNTAVAADPDRDRVLIVDLTSQTVKAEIVLAINDEPGRLVEDRAGRVHVSLRGGGALATIDLSTRKLIERRRTCGAPRGVAYDPQEEVLHVACATGELVTLRADGGPPLRSRVVAPDLRDVVVQDGKLYVSRFRSAELLQLDASYEVVARLVPATQPDLAPAVAWRTLAIPGGSIAMLHQRAKVSGISTQPGGYGRTRSSTTIHSTVSLLGAQTQSIATGALSGVSLAVDLAVSADGSKVAVAAPGSAPSDSAIYVTALREFTDPKPLITAFDPSVSLHASVIAVAFDGQNRLVAQTREPAALYVSTQAKPIQLPGVSRADAGHDLFHQATAVGLACASCHPEAGEDGRVWKFDELGSRRTQALRGGLLATGSFHWDGEFTSFAALLAQVYTGRMSGPRLTTSEADAVAQWINAQPAPAAPPAKDPEAVERGRMLFADKDVGCASCHNGPKHTNNQTVDVGTGGSFQVPWLVGLAARAPFLHTGCATTLRDRFGPCGGGDKHGRTSQLSAAQISDLVAYLETL